jgi:hypothetical protein
MAIFSKSPEKLLTDNRDAAKKNAERLAARLADAEANVIATKSAAQRAALDGDDATLDLAENAGRAALQRHVTILAAHAEAGKVLADLETQIAETTDKKTRTATAAATNNLADEIIEAGDNYLTATKLFHAVCARALTVSMEAQGLETFTRASGIEVAAALPVVAEVLREYGRAVLQGFAKAEMPTAEPAAVKPLPIAKPATRQLFATRAISWTEGDLLRIGRKFTDVELPIQIADRAIKARVCVEMNNSARNRQTLNAWPSTPSPASCFNLDADAATPQHDSVVHSAFERVDRGPAYQLRVAGAK